VNVSIALVLSAIVAAAIVGRMGFPSDFKLPWLTGVTCVLLTICFVAQQDKLVLLSLVERDASAIRAGQAYRLFTALWFQDGGVAGAAFNIAMLAMLGFLAEQSLNRVLWLGIYLVGGLLSQVVGLVWQPVGAGNSIAYMSLAGALLGLAFSRRMSPVVQIIAALGLAAGLLLAAKSDIHGAAVLIGCALVPFARIGEINSGLEKPS
jgi:rhomboid protease GluP